MTNVMRAAVVLVGGVILSAVAAAPASTQSAPPQTITMNAIDANGVGKEIGTVVLSDTQAGLKITPQLVGLPPGDHGFHVHVNPNCGPGAGPNASQRLAWRRVAITTQPTPENTSGPMARATRATCQC